jgi:hypothetical protein
MRFPRLLCDMRARRAKRSDACDPCLAEGATTSRLIDLDPPSPLLAFGRSRRDRSLPVHPPRTPQRRGGHRTPPRARLRPRSLRAHGLSPARGRIARFHALLHRHRGHAARRIGSPLADLGGRGSRPRAWAADRRAGVQGSRHRRGVDDALARGGARGGARPRAAGWRRALLRAVRVPEDTARAAPPAGPRRSGSLPRLRTDRGRAFEGAWARDAAAPALCTLTRAAV